MLFVCFGLCVLLFNSGDCVAWLIVSVFIVVVMLMFIVLFLFVVLLLVIVFC